MRNLIAILRGVRTDEIMPIAQAILDAGIQKIEIPLNSPNPFSTIEVLCKNFEGKGIFGAGTVLREDEVQRLSEIGAQLVVSPNCDQSVIQKTKSLGMQSYPGVMTPTECFTALEAGADGLKFFPGELVGPIGLKAIRAVLPLDVECLAVGGAKPENFADWKQAGASGFGIGSAIYKGGDSAEIVHHKAAQIVASYDKVMR